MPIIIENHEVITDDGVFIIGNKPTKNVPNSPVEGMIRYHQGDFEFYRKGKWDRLSDIINPLYHKIRYNNEKKDYEFFIKNSWVSRCDCNCPEPAPCPNCSDPLPCDEPECPPCDEEYYGPVNLVRKHQITKSQHHIKGTNGIVVDLLDIKAILNKSYIGFKLNQEAIEHGRVIIEYPVGNIIYDSRLTKNSSLPTLIMKNFQTIIKVTHQLSFNDQIKWDYFVHTKIDHYQG